MDPISVVQRCYFVRLRDDASAQRDTYANELVRELRELCGPYPVWVGVPGDDSAARWDLAILISFASLSQWQELAAGSAFCDAIANVTAAAAVIKAWTFATPAPEPDSEDAQAIG
jgi:hypothetical protein